MFLGPYSGFMRQNTAIPPILSVDQAKRKIKVCGKEQRIRSYHRPFLYILGFFSSAIHQVEDRRPYEDDDHG